MQCLTGGAVGQSLQSHLRPTYVLARNCQSSLSSPRPANPLDGCKDLLIVSASCQDISNWIAICGLF